MTGITQAPERARERELKRLYGLTLASYDALLAGQGGGCAVCGKQPDEDKPRRFHVDHCHESGSVRGILCPSCNRGIGLLGDSYDGVRAAADYLLRSHQEQSD